MYLFNLKGMMDEFFQLLEKYYQTIFIKDNAWKIRSFNPVLQIVPLSGVSLYIMSTVCRLLREIWIVKQKYGLSYK